MGDNISIPWEGKMNVAQTILNQLKIMGTHDMMCWGVHALKAIKEGQLSETPHMGGLIFRVNGLKFKGQVFIKLTPLDLYQVEIGNLRKGSWTAKQTVENVFVDDLVQTIDSLVEGYYSDKDYEEKAAAEMPNLLSKV